MGSQSPDCSLGGGCAPTSYNFTMADLGWDWSVQDLVNGSHDSATLPAGASTEWDEVTDTEGKTFKTKFTLAVPGGSETLRPSRIEAGRPAQADDRKLKVLGDLAVELRRKIGNRTITLGQVGMFLAGRNFRNLALEARLNMKAPVANFLRAFPDTFEIDGNNVKVKQSQPAFRGAQRLRRRV